MKIILKLLSIAFTIFYMLYSFIIAEHLTFGEKLFVALTWQIKSAFTFIDNHTYWR